MEKLPRWPIHMISVGMGLAEMGADWLPKGYPGIGTRAEDFMEGFISAQIGRILAIGIYRHLTNKRMINESRETLNSFEIGGMTAGFLGMVLVSFPLHAMLGSDEDRKSTRLNSSHSQI